MMFPGSRLSLGSDRAEAEHEADTLIDMASLVDSSYHADTFDFMAPPSPTSPLAPGPTCTQRHSLGQLGHLGFPVDEEIEELPEKSAPSGSSEDPPKLEEWRRKKANEFDEKIKSSKSQHQHVLEQAKKEREEFYSRRAARISATKAANRDKEKAYIASLDHLKKTDNDWEAVVALVDLEKNLTSKTESSKRVIDLGKPSSSRSSINSSNNRKFDRINPGDTKIRSAFSKPGGETDMSRMKQILLKLKLTPPKLTLKEH